MAASIIPPMAITLQDKLVVAFAEGASSADPHAGEPTAPSEDELYELMKETFDARDVEDQ